MNWFAGKVLVLIEGCFMLARSLDARKVGWRECGLLDWKLAVF